MKSRTLVVGRAAILVIVAGAGGRSSASGSSGSAADSIEMSFDLSKCQQQAPNLYKCSAIDKPLCTPEFSQPEVQCIRLGKKGSVFVTMPGKND